MAKCPSCAAEVPQGKRFCADCGNAVVSSHVSPTETSAASPPSLDSVEPNRFVPGTMLAGRYRIVGLLGRGGMGEVYRADDLRLGQPVALKFLPKEFEQDPSRLARFMSEVRIARQVTHPNVCRVHDVAQIDAAAGSGPAQHFLSMEYVDGEDLGSLLRRIGRLPRDKAVAVARQICAGLAAAHEQGILHRDLKPANVMIDGRGRARLTDFGLAGLAAGFTAADSHAGTPAYMAPEQLAGKTVSVKTDLYSLGLVLYELFTGRRAFEAATPAEIRRLQQESTPTLPSSHVSGLDPTVERVILRCLEKDPTGRPASALAVAAALPGGDPLAAALAAGETPSPEMVAAAGPEGGLRPGVAVACLATVLLGLVAVAFLADRTSLYARMRIDKPMAALADNAGAIVAQLGYDEPPADSESHFTFTFDEYLRLVRDSAPIGDMLAQPGQQLLRFSYRQSPSRLAPNGFGGSVGNDDPPREAGDIHLTLDLQGHLSHLSVRPPGVEFTADPAPTPDWSALFDAAGLDMARFEEVPPTVQPEGFADVRRAWTGVLPDAGDVPVRIEAAAFRGRPVDFEKIRPSDTRWSQDTFARSEATAEPGSVAGPIILTFFLAVLAAAVYLALRNFRLGRGDRKGAVRMAAFVFCMRLASWAIGGHHVAASDDVFLFVIAASGALFLAAITWVLYMALEPYVRRLWPQSIVSWSRLLAGRLRDPLVGRDLLIGMTLGVAIQLVWNASQAFAEHRGWFPPPPNTGFLGPLRGGRYVVGELFTIHVAGVAIPLGLLLLYCSYA